jgi:hypothetical protein
VSGFFTVYGIHLEGLWGWLVTGAIVLAVLAFEVAATNAERVALPQATRRLAENPRRRKPAGYVVIEKRLKVRVLTGPSARRDAFIEWDQTIRCTKGEVRSLEFPLLGEVPTQNLSVRASRTTRGEVSHSVTRGYGHSPTVTIDLPDPPLKKDETEAVAFSYTWPGVANIPDDCWLVDLLSTKSGCRVQVDIEFDTADQQEGSVSVARRRFGWWSKNPRGAMNKSIAGNVIKLSKSYVVADGDQFVFAQTHPIEEKPLLAAFRAARVPHEP